MGTGRSTSTTSGAPSARSLLTSLAIHGLTGVGLLMLPAGALLRGAPPRKQLDVVFYRPPQIEIPVRAVPLPLPRGASAAGPPLGGKPHAPAPKPIPNAPEGPLGPGKPALPQGPGAGAVAEAQPQPQQ